jgi:site-specific DNA recombinase
MNNLKADVSTVRVATYSRYSSKLQNDSSIEDQQRDTHAHAARQGWVVVADFVDKAISGSDGQRPQFLAMQAAAVRKQFDVLLLFNLARLSRDSVDQELAIRELEGEDIRIITTSDGYDSQSPMREFNRQIKGSMNEQHNKDLAANVHKGFTGMALKKYWCGGRPYGYQIKLKRDTANLDIHGEPAKLGSVLVVDPVQAKIVEEIFARYVNRESCLSIAKDLNARGVPSPGSTWARVERCKKGWRASGVNVIIENPRYTGLQRWNTSRFEKHWKTKKDRRKARPPSEWITHRDESLRIVTDEMFQQAQQRTKGRANADQRLRQGCKAAYLLSGLLRCAVCGSHYTMGDKFKYVCSAYNGGRACKNGVRVRRDALEAIILDPIRKDLKDPARVKKMAAEIEADFAQHMRQEEGRSAPEELLKLDARIAKLKGRLAVGDEDMDAADIQAAIDRADEKRRRLKAVQPVAQQRARIMALLPKAAAAYLRRIEAGMNQGNPQAVIDGRQVLKHMIGTITLTPGEDGSLWASYGVDHSFLVKGTGTTGIVGRGDRI